MSALRRIVFAALIAGTVAGVVSAALQAVTTWPLIREAETFEAGHDRAPGNSAAHAHEPAPFDTARAALTVLTDVLAGIGFALLLVGGYALADAKVDARSGIVWGMAGFASFSLAPALGLPPTLPGAAEAELAARQLRWVATAACTAGGIWLIAFRRSALTLAAAVALIVLPHIVGAPEAEGPSTVPATLAARFVTASLVTAAVFWAVLGATAGWIYERMPSRATRAELGDAG